jgi:hypothetical protein
MISATDKRHRKMKANLRDMTWCLEVRPCDMVFNPDVRKMACASSQKSLVDGMSSSSLADLPIKIFADGADLEGIIDLYRKPFIKGLTTNPTLMRKVGITNYETFARSVLEAVTDKPISFEVFSDEFPEMRRQALKIRDWQDNVYIKIPGASRPCR